MIRRRTLLLGTAGLIAAGAGLGLSRWLRPEAAQDLSELVFPDLDGRPQAIRQWLGKTVVLNFWAPWCEPCREEIPALIRIQNKLEQSVQVLGISLDNAEKVREFASKLAIQYPLLLGGLQAMDVMRDSGNKAGVLPYSIVLSPQGRVEMTHLGVLVEAEWERQLRQIAST